MIAPTNSSMARRTDVAAARVRSPSASRIAAHQVPRPRLSTCAGVPEAPSGAKISRDGIANRTKKKKVSRLTASKAAAAGASDRRRRCPSGRVTSAVGALDGRDGVGSPRMPVLASAMSASAGARGGHRGPVGLDRSIIGVRLSGWPSMAAQLPRGRCRAGAWSARAARWPARRGSVVAGRSPWLPAAVPRSAWRGSCGCPSGNARARRSASSLQLIGRGRQAQVGRAGTAWPRPAGRAALALVGLPVDHRQPWRRGSCPGAPADRSTGALSASDR